MGFPTQLVVHQPVLDLYLCSICNELLEEPVILCEAPHVACRSCTEFYKTSGKSTTCPAASCEETMKPTNKAYECLQEVVMSLEVYCAEGTDGGNDLTRCQWQGQLASLNAHKLECLFMEITCPDGCGANYMRKDASEHLSVCPNANIPCEFATIGCPFSGTKIEIDSHHAQQAPFHFQLTKPLAESWELMEIQWGIPLTALLEAGAPFSKSSSLTETSAFSLALALSAVQPTGGEPKVALSVCVMHSKVQNATPVIRELQVSLSGSCDPPVIICRAFQDSGEQEMIKRQHGSSFKWTVSVPLCHERRQGAELSSLKDLITIWTEGTNNDAPSKTSLRLDIKFWIRPKVICVLEGFDETMDTDMDADS